MVEPCSSCPIRMIYLCSMLFVATPIARRIGVLQVEKCKKIEKLCMQDPWAKDGECITKLPTVAEADLPF
jgi:hypothetical protein